jgi:hypothetical protein
MLNLLRALFGRPSTYSRDPRIVSLVARAVEQIDPRLKSFGNYPRAYLPAITAASRYVSELVAALPDCIELRPSGYAQVPQLHALFSDVEAIYNTVRESKEIKAYCREQGKPQGGELFALMGMRRHQKTGFGPQLSGEDLLHDVQQSIVYFDTHTLTLPSVNSDEFKEKIERHLFDSLIKSLSEHIATGVRQRQELETERDMLASHLRSHPQRSEEMEGKLLQLRAQIDRLNSEYVLSNYYRSFETVMAMPQQYLSLEQCEMPIDMRGVMRESEERLAGNFVFYDLVGRDRRRWTLCPVRLPVEELGDAMHCGSEKERWMEM